MERISIFNYEAFYLDYLEGNLSDADTAMLMAFLEEHPECRMEEELLVTLDEPESFSYQAKNSLKQVDESDAINLSNVEHFIIADAEGILDKQKQSELHEMVAESPVLQETQSRYKAVYFTPDTSLHFQNKRSLKRRESLVLWPYISVAAAAAAVVALVFLTDFDNSGQATKITPKTGTPVFADNDVTAPNEQKNTSEVKDDVAATGSRQTYAAATPSNTTTKTASGSKKKQAVLEKMPIRQNGIASELFANVELRPVSVATKSVVPNESNLASASNTGIMAANNDRRDYQKMTNPIAPVTKFI